MKIGFMELVLVFVVALLVIGPDKLPSFAQKLGAALKEFRKASADVTKEVRENVIEPLEDAQRPIREAMEPLEELNRDVKRNFQDVERELKNIGKPAPKREEPAPAAEAEAGEGPAPGADENAAPEADANAAPGGADSPKGAPSGDPAAPDAETILEQTEAKAGGDSI